MEEELKALRARVDSLVRENLALKQRVTQQERCAAALEKVTKLEGGIARIAKEISTAIETLQHNIGFLCMENEKQVQLVRETDPGCEKELERVGNSCKEGIRNCIRLVGQIWTIHEAFRQARAMVAPKPRIKEKRASRRVRISKAAINVKKSVPYVTLPISGNMAIELKNVSVHGAAVYVDRRLEPGEHVVIMLTDPNIFEEIRLPAVSKWCKPSGRGDFIAGTEFTRIEPRSLRVLKSMVNYFSDPEVIKRLKLA